MHLLVELAQENNIDGKLEIELMKENDLHLLFKNQEVWSDNGKPIPISRYWLASPDRRQYDRIIFDPKSNDPRYYNLWRGFAVEPKQGDCSLYLQHIRENICNGNEEHYQYILAWMAYIVQNPGSRPEIAIVLRGARGTGKNVLVDQFGQLYGHHYHQVTQARHLTGNFNAHLRDCLLLFVNEALWAGDRPGEGVLKSLITDPTFMVELKFKDAVTMTNRLAIIMASNNDWVIPAGTDERRFFVLKVGEEHKQDRGYFKQIIDQMDNGGREALLDFLQNYDLTGIDVGVAPKTTALLDQKIRSLASVESFWYGRLMDGQLLPEHEEWKGEVITPDFHEFYVDSCKKAGISRRVEPSEFGKQLKKLCEEMTKPRVVRNVTDKSGHSSKKKVHVYQFPTWSECRKQFEIFIGAEIDWPDDEDESTDTDSTANSIDDMLSEEWTEEYEMDSEKVIFW